MVGLNNRAVHVASRRQRGRAQRLLLLRDREVVAASGVAAVGAIVPAAGRQTMVTYRVRSLTPFNQILLHICLDLS